MKQLREFTSARVGLGSVGGSMPLAPLLDFRLAHARARDAVHIALDSRSLIREIEERGWSARSVQSTVRDRQEYLHRPDKGRILNDDSVKEIGSFPGPGSIAFIIADGLSALAAQRHALPLLEIVFASLAGSPDAIPDAAHPIWIAQQSRVALGDHVGELLDAALSVMLIGERPGLSTPDSLGVYLTWQPRRGKTDSQRNCISNIHAEGLSYEEAAHKLLFLIGESQRRRLSGVALKDTAGRFLPGKVAQRESGNL